MRATKTAAGFASALFLCLLAVDPAGAQPASSDPMPAPPASAAPAEDGQWTMPAKNYASTRYSELAEINADNVGKLQVAFTFSTGVNRGQEAAPIVVGGTMYVLSPYPNILYALDLTKPGAPLKWKYEPKPEAASQGVACCDVVNRGAIFADGKIFYNTLDGNTVAVDAETGKEAWKTKVGDINIGETMTMAPLVAKGKVLVGNSGGEIRRARLAQGARRQLRQDGLDGLLDRPRQGRADRARTSSRSTTATRARTSASRPGRRMPGSRAAARSGAGSPTIPTST